MEKRHILVTSALPNANGSIHLGHLLEHIQTDIWVRFQRMRGHECIYVCADDTHGTAIMLKAEERNVSPEALIREIKAEHEQDFRNFLVDHDDYYSTHSDENKAFSSLIYERLKAAGQINIKTVNQLYDPERKMFLADRFIVGSCPKCKADGQYGDNCEVCGATYDAMDLINPRSKISGAEPVTKESTHFFFALSNFTDFLRDWTRSGTLQEQVANKLSEWLTACLQDWAARPARRSRIAPLRNEATRLCSEAARRGHEGLGGEAAQQEQRSAEHLVGSEAPSPQRRDH